MSLHDRIMELPTKDRHLEGWSNTRMAWLAGFDTGLHESAQIATEADDLMAEMAEALTSLRHEMMESGNYYAEDFGWPKAKIKTNRAIEKYNAWKETTT